MASPAGKRATVTSVAEHAEQHLQFIRRTMERSSTIIPTFTACKKCSSSIDAVTTGRRANRWADTAAQMSVQATICPPKAFPWAFECDGSTVWVWWASVS